jgi:hypothetical protein
VLLAVPEPQEWDLWRPRLYRLVVRLESSAADRDDRRRSPGDQASVWFGMRSITIEDGAILLNGRPILLRGVLDQDFWPQHLAFPSSRAALESQVVHAREMGLNLLRCHVKVPDERYLDVADKAGILVWCELPSWSRFSRGTSSAVRRLLARMLEQLGNHPSIIAWTVVNEDWGTDLRNSARDRRWLRATVERLKAADPTRLVVDNSACETPLGPNFHLRTDLLDFHSYRSMPDGATRWRSLVSDFAGRPAWLWSPHGDASPNGDEPLVLSEFGGWGLPRPSDVLDHSGRAPWWWTTGRGSARPAGLERRFARQRLDRIWADPDGLAQATQRQQFEGLAAQVRELRRHGTVGGFVITELSDACWEANGLLDMDRRPKSFTDQVAGFAGPDALIVDVPRTDVWSGERVAWDVIVSSFPDTAGIGDPVPDAVEWRIDADGAVDVSGAFAPVAWPHRDVGDVGRIEITLPSVQRPVPAELTVTARRSDRERSLVYRRRLVVVPTTADVRSPLRVAVIDPQQAWGLEARMRQLGDELVPTDRAELIVAACIDRELLAAVEAGIPALVLARSADAVPRDVALARPVVVSPRRSDDVAVSDPGRWDGDWISIFAWALPGCIPGLSLGGLLGEAHAEVFPDHVLEGLDVAAPQDGVEVGMFVGWIHDPVALLASFAQGAGRLTVTTLRLSPENGPVATALVASLVRRAAGRDPVAGTVPLGATVEVRPG